jgi:hypothetical protein
VSTKLVFHTNNIEVVGVFFQDGPGAGDELRSLLAPLTSAAPAAQPLNVTSWPWMEAAFMLAGCDGLGSCEHGSTRAAWKGKSAYVSKPGLSREGISVVETWMFIRSLNNTKAFAGAMFDGYGGRVEDAGSSAASRAGDRGAFAHRSALFGVQLIEYWFHGRDDPQQSLVWVRDFAAALKVYTTGGAYVNYIDADLDQYEEAYYGTNSKRLRDIKAQVDPDNVFQFSQSVRPAE